MEQLNLIQLLYKSIKEGAADNRSKKSILWFKEQCEIVSKDTDITPDFDQVTDDESRFTLDPEYGTLYHFKYRATTKDLPYYDRFPLSFIIRRNATSFYGLNMHYLHYPYRAVLMEQLYSLQNNTGIDKDKRLILTYRTLNKSARFKFFRPCIKHYLFRNMKSPFMKIDYSEWNMALFLPTENFVKVGKKEVWEDSIRIIKGMKK